MIVKKLQECFGENEQFTRDIASNMSKKLLENLKNNRKEESNSKVGLAMLFDQSGGQLTDEMTQIIHNVSVFITRFLTGWASDFRKS